MDLRQKIEERDALQNKINEAVNSALAKIRADLSGTYEKVKDLSKEITDLINEEAKQKRIAKQKDFGVIDLELHGVKIKHDLPKKIDWDQKALASIVEKIKTGGDDPAEYVKTEYSVPEKKFTAWPKMIQKMFLSARTEKPGKAKIQYKIGD